MEKKRFENQPIADAKYPGFKDLSSLSAVKIRSGFPLSDDRNKPDESILTITVCFYGGEPFLASGKMERTWRILKESDAANRFRFMVYTSGELLSNALNFYPEFMKSMWLYSISIDGDEEQHNRIRQGTSFPLSWPNTQMLSLKILTEHIIK